MKVGNVRMVNGGLFPTVAIEVHRTRAGAYAIEALLDSGFNGPVSLPADEVEKLGLPLMTEHAVTLADGSDVNVKVHVGHVRFANEWHRSAVLATGDVPTVGMRLMKGLKVCFEADEDGDIEVEALND